MTAAELTRYQLEDSGFQLERCLEHLTEGQLDARAAPQGMSARDMVEHLCEAYQAFVASAEGKKYSWGTFSIQDKSKENLLKTFREERQRAVQAAMTRTDEKDLKNAYAYLTAHDAYHVGQLCLVNLAANPSWDPYSIYNH